MKYVVAIILSIVASASVANDVTHSQKKVDGQWVITLNNAQDHIITCTQVIKKATLFKSGQEKNWTIKADKKKYVTSLTNSLAYKDITCTKESRYRSTSSSSYSTAPSVTPSAPAAPALVPGANGLYTQSNQYDHNTNVAIVNHNLNVLHCQYNNC